MKRSKKKHDRKTVQNALMPDKTIGSNSCGCSNRHCDHVTCTDEPFSIKVNPLTGKGDYQTESAEVLDGHLATIIKATSKNPHLYLQFSQASAVNHEWNVIKAKLATAYGAVKERRFEKGAHKDAEFSNLTARIFAPVGFAAPSTPLRKRIFEICVNGALRTCNDELRILKLSGAEDVGAFKKTEAEQSALKEENRKLNEHLRQTALKEDELQRSNNDLQAELKKSKESSAYADGVINGLQERNNALAAENAELKGKIREAEQADKRAKKEKTKASKALGPQLEAAKEECRQLSAELDKAQAAQLRLTDELAGALRLLERDGRRAQQELERHRTTIGSLTEECKGKQRSIECLSARINEVLDGSRQSTRCPAAPDNSWALHELMRERQRAEQLERLLQTALNGGARKDGIMESLSSPPPCLICADKRSEQTFMVKDSNGPSGIGACGHGYCTACLDQGNFRACPVCKQKIVMRVPC